MQQLGTLMLFSELFKHFTLKLATLFRLTQFCTTLIIETCENTSFVTIFSYFLF